VSARPDDTVRADIAALRTDYRRAALSEQDVDADPIVQFTRWMHDAIAAEESEPTAMCLATATPDAYPSARIVLLKGVDARGFVFFSDYRSRKGRELSDNPAAALCFHWATLERQVRIVGAVQRVSRTESAEYFASRPRGSQAGAWTSTQSAELASRDDLDAALAATLARFGDDPIPLPDHWGGYRIVPEEIEFWQGRPSRLHDRIQYSREAGAWVRRRLSP